MEVELAPLRSLDDFLLEGARFQVPNFSDYQRFSNRILNNLLYYQTNYFLLSVLVFLLVGLYYPVEMLIGLFVSALCFYIFVQVTNNQDELKRFKARHPVLCVTAIAFAIYVVSRLLGAVFVFLAGILLPVTLTTLHASLRMRNVKNKISRFKEYVGLKRTPMGVLLEGLGQEQEAGS